MNYSNLGGVYNIEYLNYTFCAFDPFPPSKQNNMHYN